VRAEIAELRRRTGITMLYVTHDQVEAMTLGDRVAVLHRGRLQQVAPPRELYARPANAFVAGFIGSPPMNLVPARVARDAQGRPALAIGDARLPFAGPLAEGSEVTAGFRPESLRIASGPGAFTVRTEYVEHLGHEVLAYLTLGPHRIVARLPETKLAPGDAVSLDVAPGDVYVFEGDGPS
jgi:ABC-type sugar transport system ATPase subunit